MRRFAWTSFAIVLAACSGSGEADSEDSLSGTAPPSGTSDASASDVSAEGGESTASAGTATAGCQGPDCDVAVLTWDAPTTNEDGSALTDLARYRVHVGTTSGAYDESFDAGLDTMYTVDGLSPGARYYFVVTALDTSGNESVFSNEVFKEL